jgi:LL-diaminopimelate aminotransferase
MWFSVASCAFLAKALISLCFFTIMINPHFSSLEDQYLFEQVGRELALAKEKDPSSTFISLGIGDVAHPLSSVFSQAIQEAALEVAKEPPTGYPPNQGYLFLRETIQNHIYHNLDITADEIFINDGGKGALSHLQMLFSPNAVVAIPNPSYPVYHDTSVLYGKKILCVPLDSEGHFAPIPPKESCDFIYLCSPNNPTGTAMTKEQLQQWVDYALSHKAVIIFDGAYCDYIQSDVPRSIYEIPGAHKTAIEVRSFSKSAGMTNLRIGYLVVPKLLEREGKSLHKLWKRYQATTFNGVSYIIQKAALSIFSEKGKKAVTTLVSTYLDSAKLIKKTLLSLGLSVYGGIDAPYVWCQAPNGDGFSFFQKILHEAKIVTTPGLGFGDQGKNFVRFSGFQKEDLTIQAMTQLKEVFSSCVF